MFSFTRFLPKQMFNVFRGQHKLLFVTRHRIRTCAFLRALGQEIRMPSLSPTMSEGTIVKWLKREGDIIAAGDALCEIQTDKAVILFETEEEGILAKILVNEDAKNIKVGTLIALMVNEGEDWKNVQVTNSAEVDNSASGVTGQILKMPSLSPTMAEGTIVKWYKKEGDEIAPGDVLCDIQTDKAVMSFETEEEGILARILVAEGTPAIPVGTSIALMVSSGEDWRDVVIPLSETNVEKKDDLTTSVIPKTTEIPSSVYGEPRNYGPAVRLLLDAYSLRSLDIPSTGRRGQLLKSDALNYITERKLKPQQSKSTKSLLPEQTQKSSSNVKKSQAQSRMSSGKKFVDIEISSMRRSIAKRLTESKTAIPHSYAMIDSNIDSILSLRKQLKLIQDLSPSINDFMVKSAALALKECPSVNRLCVNDTVSNAKSVDVSIAVSTDFGLITPIVTNADLKSVFEISQEIKDLATRARLSKLLPNEFQGGTFTISNLGMYGISEFSAIINPPQCAILAIAGGRSVIDSDGKQVTRVKCTLSYDRRAISEDAACQFLDHFTNIIENPANILTNNH